MQTAIPANRPSRSDTPPLRGHHGEPLTPPAADTANAVAKPLFTALLYHLESLERTAAPGGAPGQDWYRYVLSNLHSSINGFRRGSQQHVREYAMQYAEQLNARTLFGPSNWAPRGKRNGVFEK